MKINIQLLQKVNCQLFYIYNIYMSNSNYPDPNDEEFQLKTFKKREFYYHTIPKREELTTYEEIDKYRNDICKGDFKLREQQIIPTNFL